MFVTIESIFLKHCKKRIFYLYCTQCCYNNKLKISLAGTNFGVSVVLLWWETGEPKENPLVQPGNHKPSHVPMAETECRHELTALSQLDNFTATQTSNKKCIEWNIKHSWSLQSTMYIPWLGLLGDYWRTWQGTGNQTSPGWKTNCESIQVSVETLLHCLKFCTAEMFVIISEDLQQR